MTIIKVANAIKTLSRKELEECFVKSLHNEHKAIYIIKELRSWLEEWLEVACIDNRFCLEEVLDKLNELEGVSNER